MPALLNTFLKCVSQHVLLLGCLPASFSASKHFQPPLLKPQHMQLSAAKHGCTEP
jgi:hypothetical protein